MRKLITLIAAILLSLSLMGQSYYYPKQKDKNFRIGADASADFL